MWKNLSKEELREAISKLCSKGKGSYKLRIFTDDMENWRGSINLEIIEESQSEISTTGGATEFSRKGDNSCADFLADLVGPNYKENLFIKSVVVILTVSKNNTFISIQDRETYDISEEVISSI
jgi:hypothetical protein